MYVTITKLDVQDLIKSSLNASVHVTVSLHEFNFMTLNNLMAAFQVNDFIIDDHASIPIIPYNHNSYT